jgi:hypothetical protein
VTSSTAVLAKIGAALAEVVDECVVISSVVSVHRFLYSSPKRLLFAVGERRAARNISSLSRS